MGLNPTDVPVFPKIRAIVRANGTAEVIVAGNTRHVPDAAEVSALRENALAVIIKEAQTLNRPVRVQIEDPEGQGELLVSPDGSKQSVSYTPKTNRRGAKVAAASTASRDAGVLEEPSAPAVLEHASTSVQAPITAASHVAHQSPEFSRIAGFEPTTPDPPAPTSEAEMTQFRNSPANDDLSSKPAAETAEQIPSPRRSLKDTSFLVSDHIQEPSTKGWRGILTRMGMRFDPSAEELAEREDIRTVSQHWPGPRTVAVVNRKGGANKTPTVVMLSAILARYGGGPVLAWDNNESQGTLGWRTEQGPHEASVLDLVDSSTRLLSTEANSADLAHFVHHQTSDKFDVLRSDENDEGDHEITAEEVDIVHRVATKYYRMIVMDSGNTARSANWRRMIDHTNQLVVPVTAMEDRAEAARLTLQTLVARGGHDADLAHNAVVIVSESTDARRGVSGGALTRATAEAQRIAEGFAPLVRAVVRVPYDPALVNGPIRYEALQPPTQRAWLAAAAAVAQGF